VQIGVQSFVDELAENSNLFKALWHTDWSHPKGIQFLEGTIQLLRGKTVSKLNAQTTPERAKRGNQHRSSILAAQSHIALTQDIVAIGDGLPAARAEFRERLPDANVEVRFHLIKRLAIAVQTGDGHTPNPFVACRTLVLERGTVVVTEAPTELCIEVFNMSRSAPSAKSDGLSAPAKA